MLFTLEQMRKYCKHLKPLGDDTYEFIKDETLSEDEKAELMEFDKSYVCLRGKHAIINYEDLRGAS